MILLNWKNIILLINFILIFFEFNFGTILSLVQIESRTHTEREKDSSALFLEALLLTFPFLDAYLSLKKWLLWGQWNWKVVLDSLWTHGFQHSWTKAVFNVNVRNFSSQLGDKFEAAILKKETHLVAAIQLINEESSNACLLTRLKPNWLCLHL